MKHLTFSAFSGRIRTRLGTGPVRSAVALALLPALAWWSGPVAANPSGGVIVHGDVTIQSGGGGVLNINQTSANAIIDWEAFSIQAGELTRFLQPGTNAAVLNRVTGGDPSEIHGALQANGSVFVINPNGILVGAGGTIDVHGLVLSTLDISNGEFLARGDMVFKGAGDAGVTNLGRINAIGGDVFLIGKTVTNSGSIHASGGTVGLAAGEEVLLRAAGNADGGRIFVRATGSGVSGPGILNDGTIEGAAVELKAHGNHYALAINNKGSIRATGAVHSGGRVHLRGTGGSVTNSGSIHATSSGAGDASILIEAAYAKVDGELRAESLAAGSASVKIAASEVAEVGATVRARSVEGIGGTVEIESEHISVAADTLIDASGSLGGGSVRIGGGFQGNDPAFANARSVEMAAGATVRADALDSGDGGTVVLWSDGDTTFRGDITAEGRGVGRGGLVEVSGKEGLLVDGTVSTLAESGANGILLLDPKNLTISTAASSTTNINTSTLQSLVGSNHVVVSTFDPGATDAGHISVLNPVRYTSANSLTLLAEGDLYIGDDIINRGAGNINLVAGWNSALLPLADLYAGTATPHATLPGTSIATGDIDMDNTFFTVPGAFGNNGGSVYVGSLGAPDIAADRAVAVGSRTGQTNVAGHDVNVWGAAYTGGTNAGAQRYSQIGYNRRDAGTSITDPATGRIRVAALNDIEVAANKYEVGIRGSSGWTSSTDNSGNASFAQIGHGGERDSARDMQLSGEILVEAGGSLSLLGGIAYNNHASIGHGGYDNADDNDGTNLATLGGDISIQVGGDLTLQAGLGYHAHVQIGHGGGNHYLADFTESAIDIVAGGDVTVRGGAGVSGSESNSRAQAQIGHGGYNADFIHDSVPETEDLVIPVTAGSGRGYKGDITVDAGGAVVVEAGHNDGYNVAFIGNGGILADGDHSGNITVTAGEGVEITAGTGTSTLFAQIGHVSYNSSNAISGEVSVTAEDGGIRLTGGNSTANYAVIGSGGYSIHAGSSLSGGTTVKSLGTDPADGIEMRSGDGSYASTQIGNLAIQGGALTLSGDVDVQVAAGGLLMQSSALGYFSHTMIGHGGRDFSGDMSGNVWVEVLSGDISLLAGGSNASYRYNHAQIGHGGYGNGTSVTASSAGALVGGNSLPGIRVVAENGTIEIQAGQNGYSYAQIGHGGGRAGVASSADLSGDIEVRASGDIVAAGGSSASYTYAQIGHGGVASNANNVWHLGGAIDVEAGGSVTASGGGGSYAYSQIGHGGVTPSSTVAGSVITASPVSVTASTGDVLLLSGSASYTGAKIGHGGHYFKLTSFGESHVTVEAGRHIRLVSPQFETFTSISNAGTQIGHGGFGAIVGTVPSTLGYSGDITATAGGKLDVLAGKNSGSYNWSLLGHTSYYNSSGIHTGDITVTAGTVAGLDDYGVTVRGASGDFMPIAGTDSNAGSYYSFASIGHRGHSNGTSTYYTGLHGDVFVDVIRGGISLEGGNGVVGTTAANTPPDIRLNGAQIGHGGYAAGHLVSGLSGSVRVHAEEDILLRSGTARHSAVVIGHGGYASFGPMGGADDVIEVISRNGNLELDSTLATSTGGTLIGHGAPNSTSGTRQGDILIDVAGEISLVGNLSYIGHRTTSSGGLSNADLTIRASAFDYVGGVSGSNLFHVAGSFGTTLASSMAGGHISLIATGSGGLWLDQNLHQNSAFSLNLLSQSDLYLTAHAINQGSGAVNLVAGWDPTVSSLSGGAPTVPDAGGIPRQYWVRAIDMDAEIFGNTASYGANGGSVWIGASPTLAAADRAVMVASRTGQTNVAGDSVHVWGSALTGGEEVGHRRFSQIGYNRREGGAATAATGRIRVGAINDIEIISNQYEVGILGSSGWPGPDHSGFVSYAQIGHGGDRDAVADMELTGEILVEAGRDLSINGGKTRENYALIGHGGYDNATSTSATLGGDIHVTVGNNLSLAGGQGLHSFAQIGHGGARHPIFDFVTSDITVTAGGDIALTGGPGGAGGSSNGAHARIGHGGYDAPVQTVGSGFDGDIHVDADGSLEMRSGGGGSAYNYVQIGHGGVRSAGDHSGVICVIAGTGATLDAGSTTGSYGYAQIGHGGESSAGNHDGDVTVVAPDGSIALVGGNGTGRHAQVGHGGNDSGGNLGGNITVVADNGGDLSFAGGNTNSSYAMVGHGDGVGATAGTREGGMRLFAGGTLSANNGAGLFNTSIFHRSNGGLDDADYLGGNGLQIWANGGITLPDSALNGLNTMVNGNLASGPISLALANNIDLTIDGPDVSLDNADHFHLLIGGSLTMLSSYQQAGSGSVTLVAGWDGTGATFSDGSVSYTGGDFCAPVIAEGTLADFNTAGCDWFGNNNAVLTIGSAGQTEAVRIGSRLGDLLAAGHAVNLHGGSGAAAATQLGFHPGAVGQGADSNLQLHVKAGGLLLQGGSGEGSYAQIGHGGNGSTDGNAHLGDIAISFCEPGNVSVLGGGTQAYAQIGHGGLSLNATHRGDVFIGGTGFGGPAGEILLQSGTASYAYTQIGHGGGNVGGTTYKGGDASGNLWIESAGKVTVSAAGQGAYSQIGMGGLVNSNGSYGLADDRTVIIAENGIEISGGTSSWSYAQIGHGGYQSGLAAQTNYGDIYLNFNPDTDLAAGGGEIVLDGRKGSNTGQLSATYAQIGHGGRNARGTKRGDIVIGQSDAITLTAFGRDSYAHIGHGGNGSGANYAASGSIELNTAGLFQMNSGYGAEAYTLVGHGGYGSGGTANYGLADEFLAVTARAVEMRSGSDLGAFSQIGHGGYRIFGTKTADISVTTLDGVLLDGRSSKGEAAYVQIGHGGYQTATTSSTFTGDISVLATSATSAITLQGGDQLSQHAQIGHGGRTSTGTKTGNITVAAGGGGIRVLGGGDSADAITAIESFAQIGHGGSGSSGTVIGDLSVSTSDGGDILLRGGADRYTHAQIGHGGRASTGTQSGAVEVTADGAVSLIASYDDAKPGGASNGTAGETYAQIGHGGMFGGGLKGGDIEVNAKTGISLRNGEANYGFSRIGHGGYDPGSGNNPATVIVDADIHVTTESGDIVLDAYQTQAYDWNLVQIGHGGIYKGTTRSGAYRGDITVAAGSGGVSVLAGRGRSSSAQIGHGGTGISGNHGGAIHVSGDGDLVMRTQALGSNANSDYRRYARIGHGGASDNPVTPMSGDLSGDICVTLGGDILLDASLAQADASAVQIGHGGSAVKGDFDGKIVVVALGTGGISLAGGPGVGTYAQIGHGGTDTDGTMTGHLHVVAANGDLSLAGGSGASAYAMFGHGDGARSSLGQRGGGVHLFAQGNLTGTGGSGALGDGNVFFFHQNNDGLQPGDYLGGDGYQKVVNGTIAMPAYASADESTLINGNIGSGAIHIIDHTNTDYTFDAGDTFVNTSEDFYIVTGGNITVLNSYQNAGTGDVTLVAGWNGVGSTTPGSVTFNNGELCDPIISNPGLGIDFNDCESFGNGGASVVLGSAGQTAPVMIGSRAGTTTVAGHGLSLQGSNSTAGASTQIGFRPDGSGAVSGAIEIYLQGGGLGLQGGSATDTFVQIGHGGTGATSATVNAPVTITFCEPGDVALAAGNGIGAYAHIGHGGNAWNGDRSGDIRLEGLGGLSLTSGSTDAYTQIGHGGAAVGSVYGSGSGAGSVFVEAGGDVFLTGGGGANAYSQIGHGGGRQGGHFEGSVTLLSGGSVEARGGDGETSSTQIGHGGRNASLSSIGPGDILVEAAGDILLFSGTRDYSGSKIGHGNHNQKLSSFAESSVEVTAGRHIRLVSPQFDTFTNTLYAGTQIGHGGYSAIVGTVPSTQGYSGDLNITAGGKLDLIAGKNGRSYLWSLIGHTSYYNSSGQHSGTITVTTGTVAGLDDYGVTLRGPSSDFAGASSTSYYSFAAIGHRGHSNSPGTYSTGLSGDILVDAIRGGVTIEGGNGLVTPDIRLHGAQIGHGGYAAGHLDYGLHGSVRVHAQDDILLRAGTSRYAAVVIGHGGSSSFGPMGRDGDVIEVISREGGLELDSTVASTTGGGVFIGHGSSNLTSGTRQGDILVDVAGEISLVGNLSTIGHRTSTSGGISNADLTLRARSMDTVSGDSGGGLLRIPSSLGTHLSAHLNAGHLSLIGTGSGGIEMGAHLTANSAFDLNLLSHSNLSILADLVNQGDGGIHLIAGWDPSAVPFHPVGETLPPSAGSPDYREYWIRDIDANPALLAAANAYGNGDSVLTIGSATQTGAVRVGTRLGDLVAAGHAVHLYGGSAANAATQLGFHPGATNQGANGDLNLHVKSGGLLVQGGSGERSYSQIGHGGHGSSDGNHHLGDISIHFAEQGDLSLNGGSSYAYAQIGHGGLSLNATHSGAINIVGNGTARVGDVALNSGASYAYTQIGHGGGNVGGTTYKGGDANGSIWIDAAGKVTVSAAGQGAYSQIGMGGLVNSNANYGLAGDRTVVIAENGIELSGGTTSWSYAQIGNGGYQSGGTSKSHQGDIYLNYNPDTGLAAGGGEIVLDGRKGSNTGQLSATYAQIGHGGRNAAGTKRGDIVIGQSDAISLTGFGRESYAHIGHGGNGSGPNYAASGSIELNTDGLLRMNSGYGAEAYTLVGHGGYTSTAAGTTANYGLAGEIIAVTARAVEMRAGADLSAFSQIGHGGYRITGTKTADISVDTVDGMALHAGSGAGEAAYAQIGHGGYQSGGTLSGDISTLASSATSTVILQAGEGQHQYAQIGHGGTSAGGSRSGDIEVAALAGIELHGGTGNETTARIGHGGAGASGGADGAVRVTSAAHLLLASGDGNGGSAQIGHGGRLSSGVTSGIIEVAAVQDIDLLGGNGLFSSTQIGHGGFGFGGSVTDQSIAVATAGALTLLGGAANVQIGHGGLNAQSFQLSGDIEVATVGDIGITGGTGAFAYSQIGNLGMSSGSLLGGDISVRSDGNIDLAATHGTNAAYAKIGHGHDFPVSLAALAPVAGITGNIEVGAAANISLTDAMIGHLNAASQATVSAGVTQIGVSLADPADPSGGNLLADAQSEFHGADELRFYLPQRSNNQIAAGTSLNGATFPGAAPDPFDHQRDDEYTRNILGDIPQTPNQHDNLFGTGPAPGNADGYAFYYDTITLVAGAGLPPEMKTPGGGDTTSPPSILLPDDTNPLFRWLGLFPDDRAFDDWLRDREKEFSGFGAFRILYENFEQYNQIGRSTFRFDGFPSGDEP